MHFLKNIFNRTDKDTKFAQNCFAQYGEDLILDTALQVLQNRKIISEITYIDIGANHPKRISNTYWLYKRGHSGVIIEPNRRLAALYKKYRPRDIVLEMGITNTTTPTVIPFYQFEERADGLSSFSQANITEAIEKTRIPFHYDIIPTPVDNINNIAEKYIGDKTLFLANIDVEGLDFEIISELNFQKFRPIFFIIETAELTQSTFLGRKNDKCIQLLHKHGYTVYADTYVNTILIDKNILEKMYA